MIDDEGNPINSPGYEDAMRNNCVDEYVASLEDELDAYITLGVHLSHCNFGEEAGQCKYGDEDCPAMSQSWKWFGDALTNAEKLGEKYGNNS
jgi:hypothetical protein